jgi:hypothetical protein
MLSDVKKRNVLCVKHSIRTSTGLFISRKNCEENYKCKGFTLELVHKALNNTAYTHSTNFHSFAP